MSAAPPGLRTGDIRQP
jgi:phage/plasmid primase-like uncharacterized protein